MALKIKLAVLWLFLAVNFLVYMVLGFMMPGVIEEIMAGEMEGMPISEGLLLVFGLLGHIPLTMAFLSLTLKDSANRWANIIVGIVVAALIILELKEYFDSGEAGSFPDGCCSPYRLACMEVA